MSDDLLQRATRALREEGLPSQDDLAETRARLLSASTTRHARRASALRWVLPMAAAFAAGTAFAATNGGIERAVRAVQTWLTEAPPEPTEQPVAKPKHARQPPSRTSPAVASAPTPEAQPQDTTVLTPSAPEIVPEPEAPARRGLSSSHRGASHASVGTVSGRRSEGPVYREPSGEPSAPSVQPAVESPAQEPAVAPKPSLSPDLALYREAHRAHFVTRDYATALSLWQNYLARFPKGIFALEASYNRAISLVRLGRKVEAADALRPFAEGKIQGGYRRDEARALLEALTKKP